MAALEKGLGHHFADRKLLTAALTHRSHSASHNERLEFVGDGVLNCVIASLLFERFSQLPEGDLSRLRANLVRQDTLHEIALSLALGSHLLLGEGELKSGGRNRPSILADTLEALFGAIYFDAGFTKAYEVISQLYQARLQELVPGGQSIKDAKTRLQEYLQGRRLALPQYVLQGTQGEAHAQQFAVVCEVPALKVSGQGQGNSRRAAEQMAAAQVLELLQL